MFQVEPVAAKLCIAAVAVLVLSVESSARAEGSVEPTTKALEAADTGASFVDHFDRIDNRRWFFSDGWSNGSYQSCTFRRRNARVENGQLILTLKRAQNYEALVAARMLEPEPAPAGPETMGKTEPATKKPRPNLYDCAEIRTRQRFQYGTYEVAMRPVSAAGTASTMFTYIGPGIDRKLPHDEIDFEVLGKDATRVQLNFYSDGKGGNEMLVPFGYDASATLTRMAFEWRPDVIRWYINGKLVREVRGTLEKPLPSEPSNLFFSLWSGMSPGMDAWLGRLMPPSKPLEAVYDYVAFTKLGESCQFEESIVCSKGGER